MNKRYNRKFTNRKNESVEDPHELLLSLVDMGSLDVEDALLACVAEMSDAECKRILNSLSLPDNTEEEEVEDEETYIEEVPDEDEEDVEEDESEDAADEEAADEEVPDEDIEAELEARIRRLEKCVKREDMDEDDEECEECNSRRRAESRKRMFRRY